MENQLQKRIKARIESMGITEEAAAKAAGLDRGYFQKLFERPNANPRADTLSKIALALEVSEQWLMSGAEVATMDRQVSDVRSAPSVKHPSAFELPKDIEVRGTAAGSHLKGAFQISGSAIEFVRRPPGLIGARNVYALYVEGSSMEPQFSQGDLVFVHPGRPPRFGDPVVVQSPVNHDDEIEATIGIYIKQTEQHVVIGKHNPKAEVRILRNGRTVVHKIMTNNELYGV